MFIHKSKLRHLLQPDHYRTPRQFERERDEIFARTWIPVAVRDELPKPGDFKTLEVLGEPVILHNNAGDVLGYLNICSHRHCLLTHALKGKMPKLKCQYHGWEYDRSGKTNKIPDAKSFRPFDRDNARLRTFPTETLGEVVFVRLSDEGVSLRDYLGPLYDEFVFSFSKPFKFGWRWESDYQANWKLPLENSLESYHMNCIHPGSLGDFPEEEVCTDQFRANSTTFTTPMRPASAANWLKFASRSQGMTPHGNYVHHNVFPSLTFAGTDTSKVLQVILPTGPATCKHHAWMFTLQPRSVLHWPLMSLTSAIAKYMTKRVLTEDAPLFADVQRGLETSHYRGVIGVREERIHHFQDLLMKTLGQDPGPDPAELDEKRKKSPAETAVGSSEDACSSGGATSSSCAACDGSAVRTA
ncbi:MAG TPA: aromatic ring-hydroxylating dioxygenase subunit alpha [Pirellulales bacterium]